MRFHPLGLAVGQILISVLTITVSGRVLNFLVVLVPQIVINSLMLVLTVLMLSGIVKEDKRVYRIWLIAAPILAFAAAFFMVIILAVYVNYDVFLVVVFLILLTVNIGYFVRTGFCPRTL